MDLQDRGMYVPEPTMEQYFDPNHRFNDSKDKDCDPDEIALFNILCTRDSQFQDNGTHLSRGLLFDCSAHTHERGQEI
jgi:hypothetical protein